MDFKELKVSKNTDPKKLAGTIKHYLSKGQECVLLALGHDPICVSVKAVALLSSMFSLEYSCHISYFHQIQENGTLTGIQFNIVNVVGRE